METTKKQRLCQELKDLLGQWEGILSSQNVENHYIQVLKTRILAICHELDSIDGDGAKQ